MGWLMPNQRQQDIKEAGLKSRTAMAWLRDNQLPAEPICYTIAYEYLFTDNANLKQSIDSCDLSQDNYREKLEEIYQNEIIGRHYSNLSMSGENISKYVSDALSLLVHSQENIEDIENTVNQVKSQLNQINSDKPISPEQINEQAEHITECTKAMTKQIHDAAEDLHQIQENYVRKKEVATKDELTQILDPAGLITTLKEAFQHKENLPMSVVRIDIDQFKLFNDTNGKIMGDAVLKHLAKAFTNHLKGTDIVSRQEEDEYTIVLPATNLKDGVKVAEQLRKKVAAISLKKKGSLTPVKVSISVGVAEFSGKGSFDMVFDKAKKALLRSKDLGRNCVNCEG